MAKAKNGAFDEEFSKYLDGVEKSKIKQYLRGKPRNTVVRLGDGRAFKLGLFGRVVRVK